MGISDIAGDMSKLGIATFLVSLLVFAVYYVRRTRRGPVMTTDIWICLYLGLSQNFLFLPVSYSSLNAPLLGDVYDGFSASVDATVWISIVGVLFFAWGARVGWKTRTKPMGFGMLQKVLGQFWLTRFGAIFGLTILVAVCALLATQGIGFGQGRAGVIENSSLQPINNILNSCAQFFVLLGLFRFALRPSVSSSLVLGVTILLSFYGGTRSASVWPLLLGGACIMHVTRTRRMLPMLAAISALIVVAVMFAQFRNDGSVTASQNFLQDLLFGGNLTEQRDFAWVYAAWDHTYLYGKSLVAGLLGFIPSSMLSFRQEWGWGEYTTRIVGLDPATFSGFRLPIIGEAYFNFSWPGVAAVGFFLGHVTFRLAHMMDGESRSGNGVSALLTAATVAFYLNCIQLALVSVTIFVVYIHLALLLGGALMLWSQRFGPAPRVADSRC